MKRILILPVLFLFLFSCQTQRYLPETVDEAIHFGMSLDDFKALKGDKVSLVEDEMTFRATYLEEINSGGLEYIGYYFDMDNHKPLYEVILIYKDEAQRDKVAKELLGEPNAEGGKEWRITPKKGDPIMAWTYKKKLIIAAQIPETEWHPDEN